MCSKLSNPRILIFFYKAGGGKDMQKSFRCYLKKRLQKKRKILSFIGKEKYARFMQIIKHLLHSFFFFPPRDQNVVASFSNI